MLKHAFVMAVAFALPTLTAAQSQRPAHTYEALQRTLEEKFSPRPGRSLRPTPPARVHKEDFQWIRPKASDGATSPRSETTKEPGTSPDGKGSSSSSWLRSIYDYVVEKLRGSGPPAKAPVDAATVKAQATRLGDALKVSPLRPLPPGASSADVQLVAQAEVPVAKKNSYVIQLKPTAQEAEISTLLRKYDFSITRMIAPLGVITVEVNKPAAGGRSGSDESETDTAQAAADPKARLEKILEPPLIRKLRNEPVVDAAFVNSIMGTKRLTGPSGVRLHENGRTYSWRWTPGDDLDGNWGLKAIRLPPVWTILDRYRKLSPDAARPKIGFVDGGFGEHPNLAFNSMQGAPAVAVQKPNCATNHGMHVAGIAGARRSDGNGIDGIIPEARIDAISVDGSIANEASGLGVDDLWELQTLLFDDVLGKTMDYIYENTINPDNLRVINISLGYNFLARNLIGDADPDEVQGLKLHISHQANLIRLLASRVEDRILFVVAAGNDSEGRAQPLETKWASPFAWAGTYKWASGEPATNILVVEAVDRDGRRASFSNTGGHVAAPGVEILSTLVGGSRPYEVCSGTSQAAPHVTALAAILFEIDPTRTPADVIGIITASAASRADSGAAPEIDALEAVLTLSPSNLRLLADLNSDARIDGEDMAIFSHQLADIEDAATTKAAFTEDLNGDGVVDDNECFWPLIDFNGSGRGTASYTDAMTMSGGRRADLQAFELTWSDTAKPFRLALADTGLDQKTGEVIAAATGAPLMPAPCRRSADTTPLAPGSTDAPTDATLAPVQ